MDEIGNSTKEFITMRRPPPTEESDYDYNTNRKMKRHDNASPMLERSAAAFGRYRHNNNIRKYYLFVMIVINMILNSRVIIAQPSIPVTTPNRAPNFGYLPCSICAAGEIVTQPGNTVPGDTLTFIDTDILCIRLEQLAQSASFAPFQCQEIRDSDVPELCGCNIPPPPTIPTTTVSPTTIAPIVTPITSSPTATPTISPIVATTSTPTGSPTIPQTTARTDSPTSIASDKPTTDAPVLTTLPPTGGTTTMPVLTTLPPSDIQTFPPSLIDVNQTAVPTASVTGEVTNETTTLAPSAPVNITNLTITYGQVIVRLNSVSEKMLPTTIVKYTQEIQEFLTPLLENQSDPVTKITVVFVNQTLLSTTSRRLQGHQRNLQTAPKFPLDTFLNVTGYVTSDSTLIDDGLNNDLVSTIDNNQEELLQNLQNIEGFFDSYYFESVESIDAIDPLTVVPTPPAAPAPSAPISAPTSSSSDANAGGLSGGAIAGIVIGCSAILLGAFGYNMYNKRDKTDSGDHINTSRHGNEPVQVTSANVAANNFDPKPDASKSTTPSTSVMPVKIPSTVTQSKMAVQTSSTSAASTSFNKSLTAPAATAAAVGVSSTPASDPTNVFAKKSTASSSVMKKDDEVMKASAATASDPTSVFAKKSTVTKTPPAEYSMSQPTALASSAYKAPPPAAQAYSAPAPSTAAAATTTNDSPNVGAIVGGTVGGIAAVGALAYAGNKKKEDDKKKQDEDNKKKENESNKKEDDIVVASTSTKPIGTSARNKPSEYNVSQQAATTSSTFVPAVVPPPQQQAMASTTNNTQYPPDAASLSSSKNTKDTYSAGILDDNSLIDQNTYVGASSEIGNDAMSYAYSLDAGHMDNAATGAMISSSYLAGSAGAGGNTSAVGGSSAYSGVGDGTSGTGTQSGDDMSSHAMSSLRQNMVSRTVIAPPGKLGIVIDTTLEGPVVHKVNPNSPLEGTLFPGDIIVAIDDVDTRAMSASAITALMVRTANLRRKLTVLSEDITN